jgi:hypothetical protein
MTIIYNYYSKCGGYTKGYVDNKSGLVELEI